MPRRRNPPLTILGNPALPRGLRVSRQLSRRVFAIQYKHVQDGKDYQHDFASGVCMELLNDGSIRVYSMTGKRLWKVFD